MTSNMDGLTTIFDARQKKRSVQYFVSGLVDVVRYRFVLYNLISTNLKKRYRRSTLGFVWTLLNPLLTMTILSMVFSTIYRLSFSEFGLYIMSGLLPWTLMSNTLIGGSASLVNSEGYLKKVHIPKLVYPTSVLGVEVVNFLLSLISLFFLAVLLGARPGWALLILPLALLVTAIFLLGLIMVTSIINIYFRDFSNILQVGLLGLFYLTPIIYPVTLLSPTLFVILKINPFYYFIELFHQIIAYSTIPSGPVWGICIMLSLISFTFGIIVFRTKENDIIYRL